MKAFLVLLDIIETMQETMPQLYLKLLKMKELPIKKAIENLLLRCQSFICTIRERAAEGESPRNSGVQEPIEPLIINVKFILKSLGVPNTL